MEVFRITRSPAYIMFLRNYFHAWQKIWLFSPDFYFDVGPCPGALD